MKKEQVIKYILLVNTYLLKEVNMMNTTKIIFLSINDKFTDSNNPTDDELNNVVCELIKLSNDESEETGWKKYLLQPVFKDNIVPNLFNYRNNAYIEEIINKIKSGYETQQKYLKDNSLRSVGGYYKKYIKYKNKYINIKKYKKKN